MLSRREFTGLTAAGMLLSSFPAGARPSARARNVVLVHGLFADGSCWLDVIPRLQSVGFRVTAVQNPLTTLDAAAAEVRRVLAEQDGPTVLVGHSFAGTIISEVGEDPKVSALVYVAARGPDANEDYAALTAKFPAAPGSAGIVYDGDVGQLSETTFIRDFAGDIPEPRARALFAVQQPFHKALVAARTAHAAWRSRPSFYSISTEDRTINPDLQRYLAKRMNAETIEIAASHLVMISHPTQIADLVMRAAGG